MAYKHVIGLKTDVSQSNLGGNTDSNHLIPGGVGHFPSVSLNRRPVLSCSPRYSAVSFLLFPGIGCRLFFVLCPSLYLGPCFYSAGCYPAFPYVFSPASDAGVLRFVRGSLASRFFLSGSPRYSALFLSSFPRHRVPVFFPLYGEVRSSLLRFNPATISRPLRTSTSRPFRMSIPRHSMPAFISSIPPFDGSRWSSLSRVV